MQNKSIRPVGHERVELPRGIFARSTDNSTPRGSLKLRRMFILKERWESASHFETWDVSVSPLIGINGLFWISSLYGTEWFNQEHQESQSSMVIVWLRQMGDRGLHWSLRREWFIIVSIHKKQHRDHYTDWNDAVVSIPWQSDRPGWNERHLIGCSRGKKRNQRRNKIWPTMREPTPKARRWRCSAHWLGICLWSRWRFGWCWPRQRARESWY